MHARPQTTTAARSAKRVKDDKFKVCGCRPGCGRTCDLTLLIFGQHTAVWSHRSQFAIIIHSGLDLVLAPGLKRVSQRLRARSRGNNNPTASLHSWCSWNRTIQKYAELSWTLLIIMCWMQLCYFGIPSLFLFCVFLKPNALQAQMSRINLNMAIFTATTSRFHLISVLKKIL